MSKIIKEKDLEDISKRIYSCEIYSNNQGLKLTFPDFAILFKRPLVYKFGFPNSEVAFFMNIQRELELENYILYTLKNTDWLKGIIKLNSNHHRHTDNLFDSYFHFLLFLEDDTFECIADDYEIIQKK